MGSLHIFISRKAAWLHLSIVMVAAMHASREALAEAPVTQSAAAETTFSDGDLEFFEKKVRPLLADHCYECHSGNKARVGLQLDHRAGWLKGSDYRKVIDLAKPELSVLVKAVSHVVEKDVPAMPEDKPKLSDEAIADLTTWIGLGLPWPSQEVVPVKPDARTTHWSFQPVKPEVLPEGAGHPIDHFLNRARERAKVTAAPPADRATLYRRVHFDLLGLPPKYEEQERFVNDPRTDNEAWPALIDHLLGSPHYGERWARLWMDVARYSDTKGYEGADTERRFIYSYTYRDWLIRAFNEDIPYDKFVLYQLAAEQLVDREGPDRHHLAALGFVSLSKNGSQEDVLDDRVDTTFRGLMALTVSCARCHDHKFDPIPTKEYYGLYGVFYNSLTDEQVEIAEPKSSPEYDTYLAGLAEKQKTVDEFVAKVREKLAKENPDLAADSAKLLAKIDRADQKEQSKLESMVEKYVADAGMGPDKAIIVKDRETPAKMKVFIRGNPGRRGEDAPAQFLSLASVGEPAVFSKGSGRLELAQAIVAPTNPLTARNIVNRAWMWHFGEGIVRSIDDFGIQGEAPDQPELLDWLAHWFVENGSSVKKLHRLILTSAAWRQQSTNPNHEAAMLVDAENRLLWKFPRKRLELEQMRDGMLDVAGNLSNELYGRPVKILEPPYSNRRSVYAYIDRQNLLPVFRNFDFSNPQETTGRRPRTTIPMQALFTLNSDFVQNQATLLADKATKTSDPLVALHHAVFARDPKPGDQQLAESFLSSFASSAARTGPRQTATDWSYGHGEVDPTTGKVSFTAFTRWTGKDWQVGAERPLKNNPLSYLYADSNGNTHSGYTAKQASIYRWQAPTDTQVRVEGELERSNVGKGNGVQVKIATSSGEILFDQWLDPAKRKLPTNLPEVTLAAGESLYFIVEPYKDDSSFDSVRWAPRVIDPTGAVPAADFVGDFSGPAQSASAWGAYAHALLNTNRFLFVE
jgi:cytochrome c553